MTKTTDIAIVGGGIVGLVLAYKIIQKKPSTKITILDKESNSTTHGTGRNSGVIHSGIYYPPETLRAKYCVSGSKQLKSYVKDNNLWIDECGKILIPPSEKSLESISVLLERAKKNGVEAYPLERSEIKKIEPNANNHYGKAIHIPFTSVVDPKEVARSLIAKLRNLGVDIIYNCEVFKLNKFSGEIKTTKFNLDAGQIINSAGLHADKVANCSGLKSEYSFLPFKGKYWIYKDPTFKMKKLIYPIPDLDLPFLGVHTVHNKLGEVYFGPSSTPVFGRENYQNISGLDFTESPRILINFINKFLLNTNGLRDLAFREIGLVLPDGVYRETSRLVEGISSKNLKISQKVGIRSQIFDKINKKLVSDFVIKQDEKILHILNAISPAFTASFGLADYVIDKYYGDL